MTPTFAIGATELMLPGWVTRPLPGLPPGYAYLIDATGAYLTDAAGAYLIGEAGDA